MNDIFLIFISNKMDLIVDQDYLGGWYILRALLGKRNTEKASLFAGIVGTKIISKKGPLSVFAKIFLLK
jgi:hypothetical protein